MPKKKRNPGKRRIRSPYKKEVRRLQELQEMRRAAFKDLEQMLFGPKRKTPPTFDVTQAPSTRKEVELAARKLGITRKQMLERLRERESALATQGAASRALAESGAKARTSLPARLKEKIYALVAATPKGELAETRFARPSPALKALGYEPSGPGALLRSSVPDLGRPNLYYKLQEKLMERGVHPIALIPKGVRPNLHHTIPSSGRASILEKILSPKPSAGPGALEAAEAAKALSGPTLSRLGRLISLIRAYPGRSAAAAAAALAAASGLGYGAKKLFAPAPEPSILDRIRANLPLLLGLGGVGALGGLAYMGSRSGSRKKKKKKK